MFAHGRTFSNLLYQNENVKVVITQNDVRQIQLAKAALYAGVKLLMDRMRVDHVDRVKIAGAFGNHIDTRHAMVLGVIPDCDLDNVFSVGNAACEELGTRHDIVKIGRSSGDIQADITDRGSIDAMYRETGKVDAVVCASGHAHFDPLEETTEEQLMLGLTDKVMGAEGVSCQAYFGAHLSLQRRTLYNKVLPGAPTNSDQGPVTIEEPADAVAAIVG